MKKGIVVVSFGTSFPEVEARCIRPVEAEIQEAAPACAVVRAFTSNIIRKKLKKRDNIDVPSPSEAIAALVQQGITTIHVQPLHIIPGLEYEKVKRAVTLAAHDKSLSITLGKPLLYDEASYDRLIDAMEADLPEAVPGKAVVLMGHGTHHFANACYSMLQAKFRDRRADIHIASVEGYPEIHHLLPKLKGYDHITLKPLMLVAGDHAMNDMAGDEEDSFKSLIEAMGIETECQLKGLGESQKVRALFTQQVAGM